MHVVAPLPIVVQQDLRKFFWALLFVVAIIIVCLNYALFPRSTNAKGGGTHSTERNQVVGRIVTNLEQLWVMLKGIEQK